MLLMQVPLTTLNLSCKITTLLDMILKKQRIMKLAIIDQRTGLGMKEQEH